MEFDRAGEVFRLSAQDCADLRLVSKVNKVSRADSAWLLNRVMLMQHIAAEHFPEEPYTQEYVERITEMGSVIITAALDSFLSEGPDQL